MVVSEEVIKFLAIQDASTPEELHRACWSWKAPTPMPQEWAVAVGEGSVPIPDADILATWKHLHNRFTGVRVPLVAHLVVPHGDPYCWATRVAWKGGIHGVVATSTPFDPRLLRVNYYEALPPTMFTPGSDGVMEALGVVFGTGGLSWVQRVALERSSSVKQIPGFSKLPGSI